MLLIRFFFLRVSIFCYTLLFCDVEILYCSLVGFDSLIISFVLSFKLIHFDKAIKGKAWLKIVCVDRYFGILFRGKSILISTIFYWINILLCMWYIDIGIHTFIQVFIFLYQFPSLKKFSANFVKFTSLELTFSSYF